MTIPSDYPIAQVRNKAKVTPVWLDWFTDLDATAGSGTVAASRLSWNVRVLSANATAAAGDFCDVSASGGNVTITLPSAAANSGKQIIVAKSDSSANTVTLSGTVNGSTVVLSSQYECAAIVSNGTEWRLV